MKFGFTNLSVVPVRLEPKEQSEMVTQLLFGDLYKVLSVRKKWIQIQVESDGYEGFIDSLMFFEISFEFYDRLTHTAPVYNSSFISEVRYKSNKIKIVQGSRLPINSLGTFEINNEIYTCEQYRLVQLQRNRVKIKETALSYINAPYLWGGKTPFGIDCSGFTQMVYRINGVEIPRDASQQVTLGQARNFVSEAELGDLAFFDNEEGRVIHVGIVLENSKIIHASGQVRIDSLDHQGVFNEECQRYTHKLRVIQNLL